jgi:hypothetical protein
VGWLVQYLFGFAARVAVAQAAPLVVAGSYRDSAWGFVAASLLPQVGALPLASLRVASGHLPPPSPFPDPAGTRAEQRAFGVRPQDQPPALTPVRRPLP